MPVSLELGGKGATIVFDDADLDEAVTWSARAIFTNGGQICIAGSRLYVQEGVFEEFVERLVASAERHVVGDPRDPETTIGPLASKAHFSKVAGFFNDLPDSARVRTGGVADDGRWVVRPTVITGASPDARICREEVFGPVVTVVPFDNEVAAITAANDTRYGLNAMVFAEDLRRAHRVATRLRAGTVWVNCFNVRYLRAPFGGVGWSGVGREGGGFSREFFTEPEAVVMQP